MTTASLKTKRHVHSVLYTGSIKVKTSQEQKGWETINWAWRGFCDFFFVFRKNKFQQRNSHMKLENKTWLKFLTSCPLFQHRTNYIFGVIGVWDIQGSFLSCLYEILYIKIHCNLADTIFWFSCFSRFKHQSSFLTPDE